MLQLNDLSLEERKKVGNRVRGARIMAGLTQEEFSLRYSIGLSTLKNFEIARVIPRAKTIAAIIAGIRLEGINVGEEWVITGQSKIRGSAPNILKTNQKDEEVELLKKHFLKKGETPIVKIIGDDDYLPTFLVGDILIALITDRKKVLSLLNRNQPQKRYFLIKKKDDVEICTLMKFNKALFAAKHNANELFRVSSEIIAYVVWHKHQS